MHLDITSRTNHASTEALLTVAALAVGGAVLLDLLTRPSPRRPPTRWERDYVRRRDGFACVYCGRRVDRRNQHFDHATSLANGGSNDISNIVLACRDCNLVKGSLNADEFLELYFE